MIVSALFVSPRGPYIGRPGVDPWTEKRDARDYRGPHPVVAHPPCASWCRVAGFREARYGLKRRLDGGCFASALQSLYHWGGILEHPAFSDAWEEYGLPRPVFGSWKQVALLGRSRKARHAVWVTEVWQCDYGHRAQKRTWLLYVGKRPPAAMLWTRSSYSAVITGCRNRCARGTDNHVRVWGAEASRTPPRFADALIALAENCGGVS